MTKHTFRCPSAFDSFSDDLRVQAVSSRGLGHRRVSGVGSQLRTTVVSLLLRRGPAAICRLVTTRVVDSVYGVCERWLWPHISVEGFKRNAPSLTDGDSLRSVLSVSPLVLVRATSLDCGPRSVLSAFRASVRSILAPTLSPETSARKNQTSPKVRPAYNLLGSAVASTQPHRCLSSIRTDVARSFRKHHITAEPFANQVTGCIAHFLMITVVGVPS